MQEKKKSARKGYQLQAETRQANRDILLAAAIRTFGEIGYDAATTRDILSHTELSPGTFYNHFTDKEDIFREILRSLSEQIWHTGRDARAKATNAEEFFRNTFTAFFSVVGSDENILRLVARNQVNIRMARTDPGVQKLFEETQRELSEAIERGVLPPIPVATFHLVGFGAFFEIVGAIATNQQIDVEQTIADLTKIFSGAVRAFEKS